MSQNSKFLFSQFSVKLANGDRTSHSVNPANLAGTPLSSLFCQVPYEILNKRFRAAQKAIDREVSHVQASTVELERCLQRSPDFGEVTKVLSGMVEKFTILKRKVGGRSKLATRRLNVQNHVKVVFKIECPKIPLCVICVHSFTNIL